MEGFRVGMFVGAEVEISWDHICCAIERKRDLIIRKREKLWRNVPYQMVVFTYPIHTHTLNIFSQCSNAIDRISFYVD